MLPPLVSPSVAEHTTSNANSQHPLPLSVSPSASVVGNITPRSQHHSGNSASALSPFVAANLIMATPPADAGLSGLHGNYDDEPSSDSLPDFE